MEMKIKTLRIFGIALAAVLGVCAGLALLLPCAPAEAALPADSGSVDTYTTQEYVLAGATLPEAPQASIGYRAYVPKKKKGESVVILVSGWTCGPAWLHYAAACLAGQHGIETWTVKRRMSFYEDRAAWRADLSAFVSAREAQAKTETLTRLRNEANYFKGGDIRALDAVGYGVLLDDMDIIVRAASAKKRPVILGGWSDGVEYVMAYSHRRYADGRRGHERLSGLLFVDENPEWGTHTVQDMRQKQNDKRAQALGAVYERRYPEVTIFEAIGAMAAADKGLFLGSKVQFPAGYGQGPQTDSPFAALFPQRPRMRLANAALLGWLYDGAGTATSAWSWLVTAGSLDDTVTPVDWKDGGHTPLSRLAAIHALPEGVWEWFYPHRIAIEYWDIGIAGFDHAKLRIAPDTKNRLPVFAAVSGFNRHTGAGLPAGIRWWVRHTGIAEEQVTLLKLHHFKHADILLSPDAEEQLWAPFATWLGALSGAPKK